MINRIYLLLASVLFSTLSYAADYFWVGANGSWNDAQNWASTSGGNGGAGVPQSSDNAYFDNNSFTGSAQSIDLSGLEVASFSWNEFGSASQAAFINNSQITVNGNITLKNLGLNPQGGQFDLHGIGHIDIDIISNEAKFDLNLNGQASYHLKNQLILPENTLNIASGHLYIEDYSVFVNNFSSTSSSNKEISILNGSILLVSNELNTPYGTNTVWSIDNNSNIVFTTRNTIITGGSNLNTSKVISADDYKSLRGGTFSCGNAGAGEIVFQFTTSEDLATWAPWGVSCRDSCNGEVNVVVDFGGVGPFDFQWVTGPNAATWSTACGGGQTVVVTDQGQGLQCFGFTNLTEPPPITVIFSNPIDPSCFGECDGQVNANAAVGSPPANYTWNSGQANEETTQNVSNLCTGINTLLIEDGNGCIFDTTFFLNNPPQILANVDITNVFCNGACDGYAISNPSGGNGAPYYFEWAQDPGNLLDSTGSLCPGFYDLRVYDVDSCFIDTTFEITEPTSMIVSTVSQTNLTCFGVCTGEIEVSTTNGTSPYSYEWFDATTDIAVPGQDSDPIAVNLCAGDYYVIVTDANGCTFQSNDFTLTQPDEIIPTITTTDVLCFGDCNGVASATAIGGDGNYTFTWLNTIPAVEGTGPSINTLCAGDYLLETSDGTGCTVQSAPFIINEPTEVTISVVTTDLLCAGDCAVGAATATVIDGTSPYTVEWHSAISGLISSGPALTINNLCAGDYFAVGIDDNGCDDTTFFTIKEPDPIVIDAIVTDIQCNSACDGSIDANATGGTGTLDYQWFTCAPAAALPGETNQVISNLCQGDYYVQVTDDNSCVVDNSASCSSLTDPPALDITITSTTNATCGGACDGEATANASGGTGNLTISWFSAIDDTPQGTGNPINTLCTGSYYAVVTDDNGCEDTTNVFIINDLVVVTGVVSTTDATCSGFCDGSASVVPAGSVPPYTFEWVEVATGNIILSGLSDNINGLCAGDYTVQIFDANLCSSAPIPFTINGFPPIIANVTTTDATCNGDCDGTAVANASGGDGNLTYLWTPAPGLGQGSPNASQMCAGSYNLNIEDGVGCFIDTTIIINEPAPYVFTTNITHEVCDGNCDGSIQINLASGGSGNITYTYVPAPTAGQGTASATGFCPGNYTCTIEDDNGCDSTFSFTVNAAQPIVVGLTLVADNDCSGLCEGVLQSNASGGTGALNYSWSPGNPNGQGTPTIIDLCAGTYDVIVADDNGCSETASETITEPLPFDITTAFNDASCFGDCDGDATVTVNSGGTPNYFYSWDDPLNQNTPTASGLCAGTYNVTITDQNGCDSIVPFTIDEPNEIIIAINANSGACFGSCSGTADVAVSGGTGVPFIEWFDAATGLSIGQTGANATGLCPGDYYAEVTDGAGCPATSATVTITEDPEITASAVSTLSNCVLCDGTATVTASGGSGTFVNYTWSPAPGAGQGTATPSSMCAGVYSVLIEDDNGCTQSVAVAVSDVTGETITPSSSDALCFGGCTGTATATVVCGTPACTFEWFDITGNPIGQTSDVANGLCAGDYIVEVTNGNGCVATESYTISDGVEITATSSFTNPECTGESNGTASVVASGGTGAGTYTYTWTPNPLGGQGTPDATGLTAGNWSVDIEDGNGCIHTVAFTLTDPPVLDVSNVSSADISCFGLTDGTATVIPVGGSGSYNYEWFECITDNPIGQTGQQATGLPAGSYYAVVTDGNGCDLATVCVDVIEPTQIMGTLSSTGVTCNGDCNGVVQVVPNGGVNNYDYQWFDLSGSIPGATGDILTNLCVGTYSVEITDLNGCTELISSVTVTEPASFDVSTIVNDANCFGDCDGTADITVLGGTAPYSFTWSLAPGVGDGTANGSQMCAGSYTVLIEDAVGCDTTIQITIASPPQLIFNALVNQITCNGDDDAEITINPSGGSLPYQYNWLPNGETSPSITGLGPDSYTVNVQDADGCVSDTTITIIEPTEITASFISNNSTCGQCNGNASISVAGGYGGYQYLWTPTGQTGQVGTALCAGIYSVDVTDAGGCTETFGVTVSDIGAETLTASANDASCFNTNDGDATVNFTCSDPNCSIEWYDDQGVSIGQTTNNATGLGAGNYFVEVTNNSGCISFEQVTVGSPPEIFANEIITSITCFGDTDGQIEVIPSGGSGGGFIYTWSPAPGTGQGTSIAGGLGAGTIDLTIEDGTGCTENFTFTINAPTEILATASSTDILCFGDNNGTAEVTASGGSFPYTYQWQDATNTPIPGETSDVISGLAPGNYFVEVTDLNGCSVLVGPILINEPVALSATISGTDVLCFGDCTGTGDVVIAGGTGPHVTNWFDSFGASIGQTGTSSSGLCPGDYNAIVVDDNGCQFTTPIITVGEPTQLTASVAGNDPTCDAVCNGDATATANGGTAPYAYNWLNGQGQAVSGGGGPVVNGLCEDIYTVEVFDDNGCSAGPLQITLDAPTVMTVDVFVNDASCSIADGDATVVVSGGTPNYAYQWFDGAMSPIGGATSDNLSGLAAGTYFVEVTDNLGCSELFQVEVGNINGPDITVVSTTDIACFGDNTGAVDIDVTGVSPPFTYVWNPGGQVGQDLASVGAGTYAVTVTDAAGCISNETVTINESQEITANFNVTDATCGLCDGAITATGSGGTGNLSYTWTTGQSGASISSLCPGVYAVDITDDNGCLVNLTAPVTNIGGPTGEIITANEPSCNGGNNGDAQVNIIGGTVPYNYVWLHDGGTTDVASNLAAGTYYLQVTDDNGCVRTVEVNLGEPAPITDISDITPATCGLCDGAITVAGDGGVAPYTYQWSHGPSSQNINALCEGLYFVDITDNNGCVETIEFGVNGATAPTVTLVSSDASCDGNCDGSIVSDTTGGAQPMTYQWLDASGAPIGQTGDNATGLCVGDYILEVTDGAGCLSFAQATVDGPTGFQFSNPTVFDALCAGSSDGEAFAVVIGGTMPYTYTWTPAPGAGQGTSHASGIPQGTYTVDVIDANGCTDQQSVTIGEPLPIIVAIDTVNDALCMDSDDGFIEITPSGGTGAYQYDWQSIPAGFTSTDEDIYNLLPMQYALTVTDDNGCTYQDTIDVDTLVVVVADAGPDTSYCLGNTFDIEGTAQGLSGLVYSWFDDQGNLIDSDSLLTVNEGEGTYTYVLQASDAAGNCTDFDTVVVTVNPLPIVSAGPDIDIIKGEETPIGGSPTAPPGATITWVPNMWLSDSTVYNPVADPDTTTTYIVTAVDANGCAASDTMIVNVFPDIVFPNGFSPNGDGVNETWEIDFIQEFPDCVVEVYNRWGELLFRSVGYVEEWDGNYNGQPLPVGTYYYVIELNHPLYPEPFDGPITILR